MAMLLQDQFRVRAQLIPDASVFVEPGLFTDGSDVRAVGPVVLPIVANASDVRRIDRVVLQRATGLVRVIPGDPQAPLTNSDDIGLARVLVEPGATLVVDAAIVDERVLWPAVGAGTASSASPVLVRRVASAIGTAGAWVGDTLGRVTFETVGLTCGDGYLENGSSFEVKSAGIYQVTCSLGISGGPAASRVRINTKMGDAPEVCRSFSNAFTTIANTTAIAIVSDVLALQAGERILVYSQMGALQSRQLSAYGSADISFVIVQRLG